MMSGENGVEGNGSEPSYFGVVREATPEEAAEAQVLTAQVVAALESLLEMPSRWTGVVRLESSALHSGVADPEGNIGIRADIWRDPVARWRTLIHEVLHTFTPVFTRREYRLGPGWEEGIIEALQRELRQSVLKSLGVEISEEKFALLEAGHPYNGYIAALESVRLLVMMEPLPFYRSLLARKMTERYAYLDSIADTLPATTATTYRLRLRLAHARLTGGPYGTRTGD